MIVSPDLPTYSVSIAMLGDSNTGKTSLVNMFIHKKFHTNPQPTVAIEHRSKTLPLPKMIFQLQIMDTCGQERYRAVGPQYYRNSAGILLLYDVTKRGTFSGVEAWIDKIRDVACANVAIMVVGNKKDIEGRRVISYDEGKALANRKGVSFIETSATNAVSVEDAFMDLSLEICEKIIGGFLRTEWHGVVLKPAKIVTNRAPAKTVVRPLQVQDALPQATNSTCC